MKKSFIISGVITSIFFLFLSGQAFAGGLKVGFHGTGEVNIEVNDGNVLIVINTDLLYIRGIPDEVTQNITAIIEIPYSDFPPPVSLEGLDYQLWPLHEFTMLYGDIEIAKFRSSVAMNTRIKSGEDLIFNSLSNSYKIIWSRPFSHDGKWYNMRKLFPNEFSFNVITNPNTDIFTCTAMVD